MVFAADPRADFDVDFDDFSGHSRITVVFTTDPEANPSADPGNFLATRGLPWFLQRILMRILGRILEIFWPLEDYSGFYNGS